MITVENVTKRYRVYRRNSDWLKERFLRRPLHELKDAIRNVSLEVGEGEVLGVIGRNGAGKSTLLKLIMGVALADEGRVQVTGRVTGLLELGTGFNFELSGAENIDFNASLLGMTADEIAARRKAIVAFSELGESIRYPLRTYSSGMVMRLAFAIAIHADPACFVVDEALSVGDIHYQQKCMQRIREFRARGGSILFVSHDLNAVKVLCDRAILLEQGAVIASGDPEHVVNRYNQLIAQVEDGLETVAPVAHPRPAPTGYGTREITVEHAELVGEASHGAVIAAGETAEVRIDVAAHEAVKGASLGIMIRDRFGQDLYGSNTAQLGESLDFAAGDRRRFVFRMPINLSPGKYTITVALHTGLHHLDNCYHWCDNLVSFEVAGYLGPAFSGLCRLEPHFIADA